MFESVLIPWHTKGNRRGLTEQQLHEHQELADFVNRFPTCFHYSFEEKIYWFIESKDSNEGKEIHGRY